MLRYTRVMYRWHHTYHRTRLHLRSKTHIVDSNDTLCQHMYIYFKVYDTADGYRGVRPSYVYAQDHETHWWYVVCTQHTAIYHIICTSYQVPGSIYALWLHPRPSSGGPRDGEQNNDDHWYNSTSNATVEQHRETMLRPCRTIPWFCNSGTTFCQGWPLIRGRPKLLRYA